MTLQILLLISLALVLLAFILWPGRGLRARIVTWRAGHRRQQMEDALKAIFHAGQEGTTPSTAWLAQTLGLSAGRAAQLTAQMQAQGLLHPEGALHPVGALHPEGVLHPNGGVLQLTTEGQRLALQIIRAHRLWERYLADEARLPLNQIHTLAHRWEHNMTAEQIDALDAALGHPQRDPHGDPIPNAAGALRDATESAVLLALAVGKSGRIVHLEDEPPLAYAQLIAAGLQVGQTVTLLESQPERVVLSNGRDEIPLARSIAANIFVAPPTPEPAAAGGVPHPNGALHPNGVLPLSALLPRMRAEIIELDERCQGFTRRRFLDLGLTPGTRIMPELENAFREPRAYRVRGTLIALRNDQADMIWVRPEPAPG